MHRKLANLPAFVAIIVIAASAAAQDQTDRRRSIQTTGEGIVTAQPDRARVGIGVVTQAATSQAASEQNAQKLTATLARLRTVLGANADIQTVSYSLSPVYRYPREGGEPSITGYSATNMVRVTTDDITVVGRVIDAATQAGANRIQQIQFTVKDEQSLLAEALRTAAQRARRKADGLAGSLGVRVTRVLHASESSPGVIPIRDMATYARAEAQTPIEPGTIEVRATVTLTVEIE
jgi:uncharacterized protein YggE